MNKQLQCLLDLLMNGLYGKAFEGSCEDGDALYALAKMHSVGNIFYKAIQDRADVSNELKEKAKKQYLGNIHQQISQDYYAEQVFSELDKHNIPYMPLKGYYLRKLYPAPELRTSCDVDFFYDSNRTEDLNKIMQAQDFVEGQGGPNHSVWQKGTITFEPHFYLLSDNDKFHAYYKNVWERLKNVEGSLYAFSDEDFYVFFIVHSAKHFTHGGFGIRTVLDIHIYNQAKKLDREYLNGEFEKLGLTKFVKALEELAKCWFMGKPMSEDTERISEYVMESGTYGVSLHRLMLNNTKKNSVKGSRISYFFKTLFLPYKQMQERYPILKKAPILLPFYWVKRWCEVLFKRRKNIKNTVNIMQQITNEKVEKYSKILEITEIPLD